MKRMMIALALGSYLLTGSLAHAAQGAASQTPRPATPAAPPASQPAPAAPQPAAPVPFPADAKVAYVNMQYVVSESKLGKSGTEKLKALADSKNADLVAKNRAVQSLQQDIANNQSVWSSSVLAQKNADLTRMQNELQFLQQQRDTDMQTLNEQLLAEFGEKVLPIVEQVRAERGLWMIFSAGDGSNIAAAHAGLDLSQEVVNRLDASGATASTPAPAPAAPAAK
jgi:Skp family chaperone for outer membrane proteins